MEGKAAREGEPARSQDRDGPRAQQRPQRRAHYPGPDRPSPPDPHAAPQALRLTGTAELNATIDRVAPAVLGLLADGVPRTRAAIVGALAGRHDAEAVTLALIRLAVTERVRETGGKYVLGPAAEE